MLAHGLVAGVVEFALTAGIVAYLQRANVPLLRINHADVPETDAGLPDPKDRKVEWRWAVATLILMAALTPLGLIAPGTAFGENKPGNLNLKRYHLNAVPAGLRRYAGFWHHALFNGYDFSHDSPLNMAMSKEQAEARVDDTLQMLGIAELADRAPYQLSGGQKKVAIASVLVMNPEVLLFDEPTAALDPRTQQWLMELIVELNRAGKTIVLATHELDTLDTLADRCLVFSEEHRVVADGPPHAVLADRDLLLGVNLIHPHGPLPRSASRASRAT
jgi:ABC-type dipeptide/oligopeptide/nickel transport system ATPase component